MEDSIKSLIRETESTMKCLGQEVSVLSCEVSPHPDDKILCGRLTTKLDCYKLFLKKLKNI